MKASERRKLYQREMAKRTEESYNTKDNSGKFGNIFRKDLKEVTFFKLSNDEHYIDIIPYLAGPNNPKLAEGEPGYFLDIWIHRSVGVNENSYVCMQRSYNKPCPICEYQKKLKERQEEEGDELEDEIKALNPTRRAIYNIVCRTSAKEEKKGVQVWEVAHFSFEKELAERAKKKKGGGFIPFADPDEGKTISFRVTKAGTRDVKISAIEFEDRDTAISDEELESAHCLDELIELPDEEELKSIFFGKINKEEEEEEERPRARNKAKEAEEEKPRRRRNKEEEEEDVPDPEELSDGDDECPFDGTFGEDHDSLRACKKCDKWDECGEYAEQQEKSNKAKEKEEEKPRRRRAR